MKLINYNVKYRQNKKNNGNMPTITAIDSKNDFPVPVRSSVSSAFQSAIQKIQNLFRAIVDFLRDIYNRLPSLSNKKVEQIEQKPSEPVEKINSLEKELEKVRAEADAANARAEEEANRVKVLLEALANMKPVETVEPKTPQIAETTAVTIKNTTPDLSLSKTDLCLAVANAAVWAATFNLQKNAYRVDRVETAWIALIVSLIINQSVTYTMMPKDATLLRKIVSFPLAPGLPGVHLYTVVQNTLPKLANCAKNLTSRPFHALTYGAVHAFNLGSSIFWARNLFETYKSLYPDFWTFKRDYYHKPAYHDYRPENDASEFTNMDPISRLTDPRLNPQSPDDARTMFQLNHTDDICAAVKKTFRELFRQVHPDKNKSPLALEASYNLETAKETLLDAESCRT